MRHLLRLVALSIIAVGGSSAVAQELCLPETS